MGGVKEWPADDADSSADGRGSKLITVFIRAYLRWNPRHLRAIVRFGTPPWPPGRRLSLRPSRPPAGGSGAPGRRVELPTSPAWERWTDPTRSAAGTGPGTATA